MVSSAGFMICEDEDLASGSGTRLDYSKLLCGKSFITVKGTEKTSDVDIRHGMGNAPLTSLSKGVMYFHIGFTINQKNVSRL